MSQNLFATVATVATVETQSVTGQHVGTVANKCGRRNDCDSSKATVANRPTVATVACHSSNPFIGKDLQQQSEQVSQLWQLLVGTGERVAWALEDAGFHLTQTDGKLIVSPASKLTDEYRTMIRDNRDALLAFVDLLEQDAWIVYLSDTGALDAKRFA